MLTSYQVPVYEYSVDGNHVMRRRVDDWINATHILKVADYDKPARTRILEREVQKGTHEKVQGGYGKYQGTHVVLGKIVARQSNKYKAHGSH
jgi:transcription factor MBP1